MAEASVVLVLSKIVSTLAASSFTAAVSKIAGDASALIEVENSIKKIESELVIIQAYISQVDLLKGNNKTFEAWLEQLRKIAYEVEDTIDEYAYLTLSKKKYAYLTGQQQTSVVTKFLRKTFPYFRKNVALCNIAVQLKQLEGRLQTLISMKSIFSDSLTERGGSSNINYSQHVSESQYFTNEDEIVGFGEETEQLLGWLTDEKQGCAIISLCGMGGLGKTTLARSIYKNEITKRHFACSAWVSVSQNFQVDDLFRKIAKELLEKSKAIPNDIDTMDHTKLAETLQSHLQGRRYLIVLDDMWNKDVWFLLKRAFVENNCGSRVVITTRSEDVASLADDYHKMKLLSKEEAWDLFCKKAFVRVDENRCPESLKNWAEKIVEKCQGLPLAIVAIGSLLSYREKEEKEWRTFYNQLNWQLENNRELSWVARVLNLSFMDLPSYLKNCFLYCGLFPEDYRIDRDWIIRLWIAEGFVEERGPRMTMEEVGEVYLNELVHRCLLQVVERDDFGRVEVLQIHDVVREITLTRSRKEMFGIAHDNPDSTKLEDEARRISVHKGSEMLRPSTGSQQLRSFLLFDHQLSSSCIHNVSSSFRLLRVLYLSGAKIDKVPDAVTDLFNLHYLDLSCTNVKNIPGSLGKLLNLQTLDLRETRVMKLPNEVTMLQKLRHLFVIRCNDHKWRSFDYVGGASVPDEISNLRSLQTLYGIEANRVLVQKIGSLTLLRSLFIMNMQRSYCEALWTSLIKMSSLNILSIIAINVDEILNLEGLKPLPNMQILHLKGRLQEGVLPSIFSSFEKLRHLKMGWSGLKEDPLPAFSNMSNLVQLHLCKVYSGQSLIFRTGWFPKLKSLCLADMQLTWITIEDGTMKNLEHLQLIGLWYLWSAPVGITFLKSIQEIHLKDMSEMLMKKLAGIDWKNFERIPEIVHLH